MSKRKNKKHKRQQPGLAAVRLTREIAEFDPNGIEVKHHRTVDTLRLMLEAGNITPPCTMPPATSRQHSPSPASIRCRA